MLVLKVFSGFLPVFILLDSFNQFLCSLLESFMERCFLSLLVGLLHHSAVEVTCSSIVETGRLGQANF